MAYTTSEAVEELLGRTLTSAQLLEAEALIPAADAWIDAYTGRTWNTTSEITDEPHESPGPYLYLKQKPVASVASVTARELTIGAAPRTLVAGTDYELINASRGILNLGGWWRDRLIRVTYTPAVPLDARIALASAKIVAAWMASHLAGSDLSQVKRLQLGQELTVEYRDGAADVPPDALTLLAPLKKRVFA